MAVLAVFEALVARTTAATQLDLYAEYIHCALPRYLLSERMLDQSFAVVASPTAAAVLTHSFYLPVPNQVKSGATETPD